MIPLPSLRAVLKKIKIILNPMVNPILYHVQIAIQHSQISKSAVDQERAYFSLRIERTYPADLWRSLPKPLSGKHPNATSPLLVNPGQRLRMLALDTRDHRNEFVPLQRLRCLDTKRTTELVQELWPIVDIATSPNDLQLDQTSQRA